MTKLVCGFKFDFHRLVLHAESPGLHAEFSCILHAKEFLLYFTWPLPVTLLRVWLLVDGVLYRWMQEMKIVIAFTKRSSLPSKNFTCISMEKLQIGASFY